MSYDAKSILGMANDAPLASDAERSGFWRWILIEAAVGAGCIALAVSAVHFVKQYNNHTEKVQAIQNPPSGSPEIGASPKNKGLGYGKSHTPNKADKSATENMATQAINTPAMSIFEGEKPPTKKPLIDDGFTAEFDKLVRNFERIL